eukprot:TRINITY_DN3677_c0_g2_i1.p1 TRINITY_DN3677_c0_g2~~TRINITY_DN3677_c0_g2_i1.p1  ORF type:complete len:359 (+),score=58.10 TRINITY_DN3677_c0_g2_i1:467-1543(+)
MDDDGGKIGEGGSAAIRKGTWGGTTVAIKFIDGESSFSQLEFKQELEILASLHHPNIVQLLGYCHDHQHGRFLLVMELIRGGDLAQLIADQAQPLPLSLVLSFSLSAALGMVFLHKRLVIHRDLKPANLLVANKEEGMVKVTDFGLSKFIAPLTTTAGPVPVTASGHDNHHATPVYAAPEMYLHGEVSDKVDVFSFGLIMWEMFSRKIPFSELRWTSDAQDKIAAGERPEFFPDHAPPPMIDLIRRCWDAVPSNRPSFPEIHQQLLAIKDVYCPVVVGSSVAMAVAASGSASGLRSGGGVGGSGGRSGPNSGGANTTPTPNNTSGGVGVGGVRVGVGGASLPQVTPPYSALIPQSTGG